jgi:hypothetical protein
LVVEFGHTGRFPEPTVAVPRPRPFMPNMASGGGSSVRRRHEIAGLAKANGATLETGAIEAWSAGANEQRPMPPDRPGERCGRGVVNGEVTFISIATAEIIRERVPVFIGAGRGKMKLSHYEEIVTPVEYCPVEWWPDLAWVAAVNGIAEHWERVMAKLKGSLRAIIFTEHELVDL